MRALLLAIVASASLLAQTPIPSCEADLSDLPLPPPSPFPPDPPPNCEGALDIVAAAANNCVGRLQSLLRTGVSPELRTVDGPTPLVAATMAGRADAARILLDAGADPTARHNGRSALCWGARSTETTLLFLERGLFAKLEDSCHYLRTYSRFGDADVVRQLLAAGFEIDRRDDLGETALVSAATFSNYPVIQALLEAGADPEATIRGDGQTSLLHAADPVETCLLLAYGADANIQDARNGTPLMLSAEVGNVAKIGILLEAGANPDLQDSQGRTALMHALTGALQLQHSFVSQTSKDAVAMTLIKAGADVSLRDHEGRRALDYAIKHGHRGVEQILQDR